MQLRLNVISTLATCLTMIACTTTGRDVLYRADGFDEKPAWAMLNTDLKEKGGTIWMAGEAQMDGAANSTACLRSAALDARARLAKQLSSRINGLSQQYLSQSGVEFDEVTKNIFDTHLRDAKIDGQYFERVVTTLENDGREDKLECFAKLAITTKSYKILLKEVAESSRNLKIKEAMTKESERFIGTEPAH